MTGLSLTSYQRVGSGGSFLPIYEGEPEILRGWPWYFYHCIDLEVDPRNTPACEFRPQSFLLTYGFWFMNVASTIAILAVIAKLIKYLPNQFSKK